MGVKFQGNGKLETGWGFRANPEGLLLSGKSEVLAPP